MMKFWHAVIATLGIGFMSVLAPADTRAAEDLPWGQTQPPRVITPDSGPIVVSPQGNQGSYGNDGTYGRQPAQDHYGQGNGQAPRYGDGTRGNGQYDPRYGGRNGGADPYARPYPPAPPGQAPGPYANGQNGDFSSEEIAEAGRNFFGSVSSGLASVIEYAFQKQGRPNGYILGEEAGGAFVAGLRYGEGTLHTRSAGPHKVYWQGPSLGYDFGAEGSKTMILVYNLNYPEQIYQRFSGIDGSAYLVGGVGITFQKRGDVVLAPIRSGVGLRLGANVGYLKYTRYPTWNPF